MWVNNTTLLHTVQSSPNRQTSSPKMMHSDTWRVYSLAQGWLTLTAESEGLQFHWFALIDVVLALHNCLQKEKPSHLVLY